MSTSCVVDEVIQEIMTEYDLTAASAKIIKVILTNYNDSNYQLNCSLCHTYITENCGPVWDVYCCLGCETILCYSCSNKRSTDKLCRCGRILYSTKTGD